MATTPQLDLSEPTYKEGRRLPHAPEQPTPVPQIVEALRSVPALEGLTDEEYTWIATHGTEVVGEDGTLLFEEGEPANTLEFILTGEIQVRRRRGGSVSLFIGRAGQMTGKLPFSRMKTYGGEGYSVGSIWSLRIHESLFPELLAAIPSMGQRSVSILLDRVREFTRMEQQTEKLQALGKLAANLAHELNNPASAAQRSAASLFTELGEYGKHKYRLGELGLDQPTCNAYMNWVNQTRLGLGDSPIQPVESGSLQLADREDAISAWLEQHHVPDPWKIAPSLAETTIGVDQLQELADMSSPELLPLAVSAFASALRVERMAETVLNSTVRIFDLISAIKDYSYMDQAPIQEVDIAQSLENTLAMFNARLRGIAVEVNFDRAMPTLRAYGSELNQVWTALIENAIDAIDRNPVVSPDAPRGTLRLTTHLAGQYALVEVADSGPGISDALKSRIFEPFFTTKPVGQGLGLGLDTVQRIVGKHFGYVTVDTSIPNTTCFQVRLPLDQAEAF
ncbi:Signal transduction histidine kinase [Granulicella pectinivorans]|jgi:signal transduction histidine kinase|uniref:histidine kinase n=1 Tax=Granulicella pectinivorans TaxID=474950 RepID=A0A1I6MYE4_9BACT|nr:ATP-binding protein [Granulicella pectinivorans]SFS20706.1 Signal transduction histidine kinase [Granulicella pectinivorans]